jgi:hypothetical protein
MVVREAKLHKLTKHRKMWWWSLEEAKGFGTLKV